MLPAILARLAPSVIGKAVAGGAEVIEKVTPKLEDEVTVEVVGQPGSTKKDLYFLALQTAYGIARPGAIARFFTPAPSLLMLEYDAADSWVRVTLRYRVGALDFINQNLGNGALGGPIGAAIGGFGQGLGLIQLAASLPLLAGPPQYVDGVLPVIPFSFLNIPFATADANRFTGARILTTDPVVKINEQVVPSPNPKPSGDNRSRGSIPFGYSPQSVTDYLVPLVFSALSAPGSQNELTLTPPVQGVAGG